MMTPPAPDAAQAPLDGPAPADAIPRARWPLWKTILAYVILAAAAALAIWYIDLRAQQVG